MTAKATTAPDIFTAQEKAAEARETAKGNPISLAGFHDALKQAAGQVDGEAGKRLGAQWAGVLTLHDKRVVDVGVFVSVRTV